MAKPDKKKSAKDLKLEKKQADIQKRKSENKRAKHMHDEDKSKAFDEMMVGLAKHKQVQRVPVELLDEAPRDINHYDPLNEKKYLDVMDSIMRHGLEHPIILWKKENSDRYMILSGHNRTKIYKDIYNTFENMSEAERKKYVAKLNADRQGLAYANNFDHRYYKKIEAFVYEHHEISYEMAKEKSMDINYLQRGSDPKGDNETIRKKIQLAQGRMSNKSEILEHVCDDLGISKTKLYTEVAIGENIIPNFQNKYFDGTLSQKAILKMKNWPIELQQWLHDEFSDELTTEKLMKISPRKNYTKSELKQMFSQEISAMNTVTFKVEEELKNEFKKYAQDWLSRKRKELKEVNKA